jgi:hypothetical protein
MVRRTELGPVIMFTAPDYLSHCLLLLFSFFGAVVMYLFTHTYIRILKNLCL